MAIVTREQALLARRTFAAVRVRPKDGCQSWHHGVVAEVHKTTATVRTGKLCQDLDLNRIELDHAENVRRNIDTKEIDDCDDSEGCVLWIQADCTAWSGRSWTQEERQWKAIPRAVATAERQRLTQNGVKGIEVIRISLAARRLGAFRGPGHTMNVEMEKLTAPVPPRESEQIASGGFDAKSLVGLAGSGVSFGSAKTWEEAARIDNRRQQIQRERVGRKELDGRLASEIAERQRLRDGIERQDQAADLEESALAVEMIGIRAKLLAMLSA
jgi:hypothetical protein